MIINNGGIATSQILIIEFEILTNNDYINGDNLIKSCPINKPINIKTNWFLYK